ncbi:metal ABC transporter permease [Ideonella oryzae]|uniref:Metal ABC transporter permease n=1 Tax=Ideonella oryzae TaxID=2937441 RepID=A0ABT1BNY0_9BURK|nr:metal ABC transporter permease [Ideonella oryzae]MCO5977928.1 metal ABC transporter permease [Ideonella oryzae]
MSLADLLQTGLIQPFTEFGFMRRAWVASLALSLSAGPVGTLLILRRLTLMGDAMSHALLPGAALGFMLAGLSLPALGLGAFLAGLLVAALAHQAARLTAQREESALAAFYLMALASGVMLVSLRGTSVDLMHLLFGNILAADAQTLPLVASVAGGTLLLLAVFARPLIADTLDPGFLRLAWPGGSRWMRPLFMGLLVSNLVAGFLTLGTLMSVGLLVLPAAAARFWSRNLAPQMLLSSLLAALASTLGLLLSYHAQLPTGPAIVLSAGAMYLLSLLCGRHDSLLRRSPDLISGDPR